MAGIGELFQTADFKSEKHVPVIDAPASVPAGEVFQVSVSVGSEIAHPNTTEHHIRYITLYFQPAGAKAPFEVGHFEFAAHGESVKGLNEGPVTTHHAVVASMKTDVAGTLHAAAYCNIHGLWQSSRDIQVG